MALSAQNDSKVRQLFDDYLSAWNEARDPTACARVYESDGDLLAADGVFLASPEEIEQYYVKVLGGRYEDFRAGDVDIFSIREIRPGVAILDGKWNLFRIASDGTRGENVARIMGSFVATETNGDWLFSAVRVMVPSVPGS